MCDDGTDSFESSDADPALDPVLTGHSHHPTRRSVLAAGAFGLVGAATGAFAGAGSALAAAPAAASPLSSSPLVRAAMHVHASCSEGAASWETQFAQAASLVDVLYLTDHDFRALAYNYLPSLNGIALVATSTGAFAQKVTTNTAGVVRTVAESSSTSAAAAVTYAIPERPTAWNRLRTYIAGHSLVVTFPVARIGAGGTYELVVQLSNHPAFGARPAGQFSLRYRFGAFSSARFVDGTGLTGVVTRATPAAGAKLTLDIPGDVAALWPDMLADDNSFAMLSMVATSPRKGTVVDVSASFQFVRTKNDSASLIAAQQQVLATYGPRYPRLTAYASVEISRLEPHTIPFGVPQFWPDQKTITSSNHDSAYNAIAASVRAQGGLVSWNHPFGFSAGPLLPAAQQVTNRRAVFASMIADGRLGTDIIEVGYTVRGQVSTQSHIDLWDTFSRQAIFMTGNGANDDHAGVHWSTLNNGFTTGLWAASVSQPDLVAALASGRAYTYHAGRFAGGQLDMLVDAQVPMGKVSVATATSRSVAIFAAALPKGSFVDVVRGPVDYTGNDPGTKVVASVPATSFTGSGTASVVVDTTTSCFVRVQVRTSAGNVVGIGNPVWLLRAPPPSGIPAARAA